MYAILAVGCGKLSRYVMHALNISLPDELMRFVDAQIAEGRYGSPSDYVLALVRADKESKAAAAREAKHPEGEQGDDVPVSGADWGHMSPDALERMAGRRSHES